MKFLLHTDSNTNSSQPMAEHVRLRVSDAVQRFGERVTGVEAHLSNAHSTVKANAPQDVHCTLEAHLVGAEAVVVKAQASNAHQAIDTATKKLKRAIERQIEKHSPRGQASEILASKHDIGLT